MKQLLGLFLALCLLFPAGCLSATSATITVFDPQALNDIALPIDAENPIDTTSLEGVDALLEVVRDALSIVLPEGTPFAVEPTRTMLRRHDNILEIFGTYRLVASDPGSPSASFSMEILHDGDTYRPLNLLLEDALVWERAEQPERAPVADEVFQGLLYPMKRGQQLDDVKRLQQVLKELGFFTGKVVITFGEETQIAVREFQKANSLQNTGMADESTLAMLYGSSPVVNRNGEDVLVSDEAMYVEYRPLRFGVEGTVVKRLQQALLDLGLYEGELAMRFGENTENAVRAYQQAKGLPATGVADHATQTLLYTGQLPAGTELATKAPEASQTPVPEGTPAPQATSSSTPSPTASPSSTPVGTQQPVVLDEVPDVNTQTGSPAQPQYPNG